MTNLKGSLSGIGLSAIVQLIGDLHHSGTLHLVRGTESGTFAFDNGRLTRAQCGDIQGLAAITACALDLAEAEFTFVEGTPGAGTLDLSPIEVRKIVGRAAVGQSSEEVRDLTEPAPKATPALACPLLGFADDPEHHYSRPTALHRCYASGAPGLASTDEQRELCLSGGFAACPRYRSADKIQIASAAQAISARSQAPAAPRTAPPARPAATRPTSGESVEGRSGRTVLLIAGGAVIGLVLIGAVVLIALPMLAQPSAPAAVVAPAATQAPVAVAGAATTRPAAAVGSTPAPTATTRPRSVETPTSPPVVTPTTPPQPTVAPGGNALTDVRFAAGPADDWVSNPPYASWNDGAYRLSARDATHFVAVGVPVENIPSDVVVSGTFRKTGGPPGGGYGFIVRDQGPGPRDGVNQTFEGYVLEASDIGQYGIWRRDSDHFVDLVPWTQSPAVRSGGSPNVLSVRAIGDHLSFTINGAEVANVQDATLPDGNVGVFVGGDNNEVALDSFTVELPQ